MPLARPHPRQVSSPPGRTATGQCGGQRRTLVIATVHAADGVQFAAVADCREGLVHRVAQHVRRNFATQLWPADAERVRVHLDEGALEAAVTLYFERVGERWDEEWLVTTSVPGVELVPDADRGGST